MTKKKILFLTLVFLLGLMANIQAASTAKAAVSSWHKSVTMAATWSGDFDTPAFRSSVDRAAAAGTNYITLVVQLYQSNLYSTDIQAGGNTPTDTALISAINYIHAKGMHVMLKMHLDSFTGEWRAYINPSDRSTWFANYEAKLLHYAQLAQANGVEDICIGTELIDMATTAANGTNTQNWMNMINAVRAAYSGKLTYSANWGPSGFTDEKNNIGFWNSLDYIGISAYFNLNTDNQVQNIKNAWGGYNGSDITPLSQRWGKDVQFTEVGYKSVTNAQQQPWNYNMGGGPDMTTQQNAYEALLEYWDTQPFMRGVDIWDWKTDPNAGGTGNTDYTPQNKPAQTTMANWFGGNGAPTPPPPPGGGPTPAPTPAPQATCSGPATNAFSGCYFNDQSLAAPVLSRTDTAINFDWGMGSPDPSLPNDHFSVRWQGNFNFNAGDYTFTATADDGIRVFVDGSPVIDRWVDQPATTYTAIKTLAAGMHAVKVEYYENTGNAVAKVTWALSSSPTPPPSPSPTPSPPPAGGSPIVYVNGYPTMNGNYIDCNGNIDNDMGHHTTNPSDTDQNHHVGQNCPSNSFVGRNGQPPPTPTPTPSPSPTPTPSPSPSPTPSPTPPPGGGSSPGSASISIWWPTDGVTVSGTQPFKAVLNGLNLNQYNMFWQVDSGQLVQMYDATDHKEYLVNLNPWAWRGNGPYNVNFVGKDPAGNILGQKAININVSH